jgi:hypothetical protein
MEAEINLRVLLESADRQVLAALSKARGTNASQTVREILHIHYEGLLTRLDPDSRTLFEKAELDRRGLGRALLKHKEAKRTAAQLAAE